jgi:hypothetical protein
MKRLLDRWNSLPLGWQIVTSPFLFPAIILWAYPEFHAISVMIAIALVGMSSSGYIKWTTWPPFLYSVSLPYIILITPALCAPLFVSIDAIKNIEDKK